jgi:hypothetical protein
VNYEEEKTMKQPKLDFQIILLDWLVDLFGERDFEWVSTDVIEYGGFILILVSNNEQRHRNVRGGCKHVVCVKQSSFGDPEFFEKLKPAVELRIKYLDDYYLLKLLPFQNR